MLTVEEQREAGIFEHSSVENHSEMVPLTFVKDVGTPDASAAVTGSIGLPFADI